MTQPTEPTYLRPALWTALVSILLGLVLTCAFVGMGWLNDRSDSFTSVLSGGVRAWLVSHGSGITVDNVAVNAVPLGAVALAVGLVVWVAGTCLDEPLEEIGPFIAVTAGSYGLVAALLSVATNSDGLSTNMVRSTIGAVLVSGVGAALGVARNNGGLKTLAPMGFNGGANARAIIAAAWSGILALLGASFALVAVMFVLHVDRASDLWAALDPGAVGGFTLAAGCVFLIPNLVLWTASVLLGPGFALGANTSVDLTGAHLGAVPGLPLLAALPGPGEFPGWVFALGLLPLLAGVIAGWQLKIVGGMLQRIGLGIAAGALAGLVCGALIAVSGGALGPGRMAVAGPPRLTTVLVAVGILALGGAIGGAVRGLAVRTGGTIV